MGLQNHISRISAFGFLIKYTKISEISRSSHFGGCTKYAKGCIYTGQLLKTATKKKTRQQQKTSKPHLPPRLIWTSKISGGAQIFIPPPNSFYFKKFHFLFPFFKTFLIWTPSLLCSFKKIARSKFFSLLFPFAHFMCFPLLFCFFPQCLVSSSCQISSLAFPTLPLSSPSYLSLAPEDNLDTSTSHPWNKKCSRFCAMGDLLKLQCVTFQCVCIRGMQITFWV